MIDILVSVLCLSVLAAPFIFICWRVDKDCRTVEGIWKDAVERMK